MLRVPLSFALVTIAVASCEGAPPVDAPATFVVARDATSVEVALAVELP